MFTVLLLYVASDLFANLSAMSAVPALQIPPKPFLFFESLFSGMLMPLLTVYLLHCTGEDPGKSRIFFLICALFAVYAALLTVTQFTTFIYYYTPDNVYHRGHWYPLLLVPPILSMLALLTAVFRRRGKLSRRQFDAFLVYFVLPLLGMLFQLTFYGLYAIVFFTVVAAMFLYVSVLTDQVDRYVRQQEDLARQRSSIMVLQMRPHFIYNTLLSIYYLCRQDPEKAQQIILDFSSYLRQNFTAIVKEDTIPFSEELEHARAYLAVEQARYEKKLSVRYDTPYTRFRIPPLTLQPVVENAVKHGLDPSLGPLRILIRTRETESGSEITVEDNGPGFSPADDDAPHIALANIRERLELMCGGGLTLRTGEEGGTVVTITVPQKN
jgi:signal transduction histidine kinase